MADDKDSKLFTTLVVSFVIILGLVLFIIFRPPTILVNDNSSRIRDSIKLLTKSIEDQKLLTDRYLEINDSLLTLPPRIKIIYREKKKFTSTATINQLDSIIRANCGLKQR